MGPSTVNAMSAPAGASDQRRRQTDPPGRARCTREASPPSIGRHGLVHLVAPALVSGRRARDRLGGRGTHPVAGSASVEPNDLQHHGVEVPRRDDLAADKRERACCVRLALVRAAAGSHRDGEHHKGQHVHEDVEGLLHKVDARLDAPRPPERGRVLRRNASEDARAERRTSRA
jgi:hypothetical protein